MAQKTHSADVADNAKTVNAAKDASEKSVMDAAPVDDSTPAKAVETAEAAEAGEAVTAAKDAQAAGTAIAASSAAGETVAEPPPATTPSAMLNCWAWRLTAFPPMTWMNRCWATKAAATSRMRPLRLRAR